MRISDWSSDVCSSDLSRLYHDGKVRRKCALRQARSLDELAGRKPVGFMLNQQAEGFEPGGMCQRSERRQRGFSIHASDLSDEFAGVNTYRKTTMRCTLKCHSAL